MELEPKQDERVIGEKVYSNGDVYTGELLNGKPDGEGTLKWPDGATYQGGFKNGQIHAQGKRTGGAQDNFVSEYAEWKEGVPHGKILIQYKKNGQIQFEELENGKEHGYCVTVFDLSRISYEVANMFEKFNEGIEIDQTWTDEEMQ